MIETASRTRNQANAWRTRWLRVHLWLGLSVGALLVIVGLTGSVLVFMNEFDAWLNPALLTAVPSDSRSIQRPLNEIIAAAERMVEPESRILAVMGQHGREGVFSISYMQPSLAQRRVFVDPYTATVTGTREFGTHEVVPAYLIEAVFQLHFTLLSGETGQTIVAIGALLLLVSIATGFILWWPLTGKWRQAFTIRRPATAVRVTFDLHKVFSLYPSLVLGVVLLSGVSMNLHDAFVQVIQWLSPGTRGASARLLSSPSRGRLPIGVVKAWDIATSRYSGGNLYGIFPPESLTGVYLVAFRQVPELSAFWSERWIVIDQYSGAILEARAPDMRRTAGESFLDWQWPLHSGQAFGWPGRLAVFAAGLACPVIFATGVLMWSRKRRSRRGRIANDP
nr:PepSY-associated TM helix domain-containing protein [Nitrospira japonica]